MRKAAGKDILRTVWKEKKRFASLMMIAALGVTMLTGLAAGCQDLRFSADYFFDAQGLFDLYIVSTMGLTDEDVEALAGIAGVEKAEGGYTEIVHTKKGDLNRTAEVKTLGRTDINRPYVLEGRLPLEVREIAVTRNYMQETGKALGDSVTIEERLEEAAEEEEEEKANFLRTEYVISAVVIDAMDINNAEGSAAFRATPNADYTFFVLPEAVDSEVYTGIYLSLEGTKELMCYSPEYEEKAAALVAFIEGEIKEQREEARYAQVTGEAYEEIAEAEAEMNQEFADAEEEIADAQKELSDGWQEIGDGWQEIRDGWQELEEKEAEVAQEIADARQEIADGYEELEEGERQVKEAAQQLYEANLAMAQGRAQLEAKEQEAKEQLAAAEAALAASEEENRLAQEGMEAQVSAVISAYEAEGQSWPQDAWNTCVATLTQILLPQVREQAASGQAQMSAEEQAALASDQNVQQALGAFMAALNPNVGTEAVGESIAEESGEGNEGGNGGESEGDKEEDEENGENSGSEDAQTQIQAQITSLALGAALLDAAAIVLEESRTEFEQKKAEAEAQLAAAWEEIAAGEAQLAAVTGEIHDAKEELAENRQKLDDAVRELEENEQKAAQEFADARVELAEGEQELLDGEQELLEGEQELEDNKLEYEEEKADAVREIEEAKQEVADLDMTQWYVQDRTSLSGYVNVQSDTDSIESLADIFTVVFFVIAILISLTTITRMVEEERGLLGTYKALGFTDREIRQKYDVYALAASLAGGILGDFFGFVLLPVILIQFFGVMYVLPEYYLQFNYVSGTLGIAFFALGILGASVWACRQELKSLPAQLMRPKAPRLGSKVLLEKVTFVWKRLSFLNKVTARNLFRYKKRLLMTIFGISGCTALILFGFAIKDSVEELMPLQYESVYEYDLLGAVAAEDNEKLLEWLDNCGDVEEYVNLRIETVKLQNGEGDTEKIQLMVFPDGTAVESYITLLDARGEPVGLSDAGIYLTENAAKTLRLDKGEKAVMQNLDLESHEVVIGELVKNYLGNNIYVSQKVYEEAFGEYEPNGILANLTENRKDHIALADELSREDWILSSLSVQELKEGFSLAFTLINLVVYVVLALAAGLAFVVLFTLATTNISERERELATIKVLGFFDREVHTYVNKESLILTVIGILLGLPLGTVLSGSLTNILDMPSIYFAVTIYPESYFLAAAVALAFALLVQIFTNRSLNAINPVEALKSVE